MLDWVSDLLLLRVCRMLPVIPGKRYIQLPKGAPGDAYPVLYLGCKAIGVYIVWNHTLLRIDICISDIRPRWGSRFPQFRRDGLFATVRTVF